MTKYCTIEKFLSRPSFFLFAAALLLACGTAKEAAVLDRNVRPEVVASVPAGASEIREVQFHRVPSEAGHEVLHLRGQLFTKTPSGGSSVQIQSCGGCSLTLTSASDTTVTANLTTEGDGYFEFNGRALPYTFTLNNPGMNPLVIESTAFDKEGVVTMRIIQAAGTTPERFRVSQSGNKYTWEKVQ
jgi:hypothetical protein